MTDPIRQTAPSLGRDALSGRLERALASLEGGRGPATAWRRAWLLTAVGRYGEALAACEETMDGTMLLQASGRMAEAMLYRQVSLHDRAEVADEQALELLRSSRVRSPAVRAAIRVGLVADAVGLGEPGEVLTRRLRVAAAAVTSAGSWRQSVRLTWVRGEVAMVGGQFGQAAKAFGSGARISAEQGARRHEAKSLIFLAAACAARQQHTEALRLARRGLQLAARCGAPPLMWPAELILAEVDVEASSAHLERARQVAGGLLRSLPPELREQALSRPPASWLLAQEQPAEGAVSPSAVALPTDA